MLGHIDIIGKSRKNSLLSILFFALILMLTACGNITSGASVIGEKESAEQPYEEQTTDSVTHQGNDHLYGAWVVTKPATATEEGVKTRYCSCGKSQQGVIPKTDIVRVNASGYADSNGEYMLFGSYPQTRVTGGTASALNESLQLSTDLNVTPTKKNDVWKSYWTEYGYYEGGSNDVCYMWYIDVTHNKETYRGVYFSSYRPNDTNGKAIPENGRQSNSGYLSDEVYWFLFEPIKWRILSIEGQTAFLASDLVIDSQPYQNVTVYHNGIYYYDREKNVFAADYQYSSIRTWLNDSFYNTAFSEEEKSLLLLTACDNRVNTTNPEGNSQTFGGGNNAYAGSCTADRVFLLSEREVTDSAYGFDADYLKEDRMRQRTATDYGYCQGINAYIEEGNKCNWLLRSPYYADSLFTRCVGYNGNANTAANVRYTSMGIVPAINVILPDVNVAKRVDENGQPNASGGYYTFGSFPQSHTTDSTAVSLLSTVIHALPQSERMINNSDGSVYIDLFCNGNRYRGVRDDNDVKWYLFEPITWRILTETDSGTVLIADKVLDAQCYQDALILSLSGGHRYQNGSAGTPSGKSANNYAYSAIRAWLNGTFYTTAFNPMQQDVVWKTSLQNDAESTNPHDDPMRFRGGRNSYTCATTKDGIYLLSMNEATDESYGFDADPTQKDKDRTRQVTDYAARKSLLGWWLRSPSPEESNMVYVCYNEGSQAGAIGGEQIDGNYLGVVPVLLFNDQK